MCSNVLLGVMVYLVTLTLQGRATDTDSNCILEMQKQCKTHNEALTEAENDHENLCLHFYASLRCVATVSPGCIDTAMHTLQHYTHSPWHCELSQELALELQSLASNFYKSHTTTTSPPETSTINGSAVTLTTAIKRSTVRLDSKSTEVHANNASQQEHKSRNSAVTWKVTDLYILTAIGYMLYSMFQKSALS